MHKRILPDLGSLGIIYMNSPNCNNYKDALNVWDHIETAFVFPRNSKSNIT